MTAKRICAWCGVSLGVAQGEFDADDVVTHGICEGCGCALLRTGDEIPAQEFLDRLSVPVLVVDKDGRALGAGRLAREVLGREFPSFEGFAGGGVIDCVNSDSDEACCGAIHCRSRVITRSVAETYETGKACVGVPAHPDVEGSPAAPAPPLRITTEKVGEFVVLRVDQ